MQVTASKVALLLECSRPFAEDTEVVHDEPTEAMRYGSALHECLELSANAKDVAGIAKKWEIDAIELKQHAIRTTSFLNKWLAGDNVYKKTFKVVSRETHRATSFIHAIETRECGFEPETHTYEMKSNELGGTEDLLVESEDETNPLRIVIDYKSGDWGEFHTPSTLPQMLALALQTRADAAAILHTPRQGVPVMYVEDVETKSFVSKLVVAMYRIGDGSLRPGPWCSRCPARIGCPAGDADLLKKANALIKVAVTSEEMAKPLDKGAFHMFLTELSRLEKRAREVLRADVKAGEIIVRPDGKVLVLRENEVEGLSKASVIRALGKQKGEVMLEKLRKSGCVEKTKREELRAVDEK